MRADRLDELVPKLDDIVFHAKLGRSGTRFGGSRALAGMACRAYQLGAESPRPQSRAAHLAKADLVSGMVGEFPELQGLMGRYYAEKHGESADASAAAIGDHYAPAGAERRLSESAAQRRPGACRQAGHARRFFRDR